ncbi:MAG: Spy/CpxP family protein refolding chaperone [Candidatus Omnitrophica bacterium]|nr:Spy/CpxP family protein refolding chaperone [Candidatus Omnitrophota bacterium]
MKKQIIKVSVLFTVLGMLFMLPVAEARGYEGAPGEKGEACERAGKINNLVEKLDLTPEQQELMKKHRQDTKTNVKELKEEMKANRKALHEEMKKYDADTSSINATVARIKELRGKLLDYKVAGFLQTKEILTQEQFEKMQQMRAERKERKGKKGEGFRGKRDSGGRHHGEGRPEGGF